MRSDQQLYCSRCGGSFRAGSSPVSVYVDGVPACPTCCGSAFVGDECRWCKTVFMGSLVGGDACPMCAHSPYWLP